VAEEGHKRWFQCPGCWSVNLCVVEGDWLECDCGEKLTMIDLRAGSSKEGQ
jgi:hypothetical protein